MWKLSRISLENILEIAYTFYTYMVTQTIYVSFQKNQSLDPVVTVSQFSEINLIYEFHEF